MMRSMCAITLGFVLMFLAHGSPNAQAFRHYVSVDCDADVGLFTFEQAPHSKGEANAYRGWTSERLYDEKGLFSHMNKAGVCVLPDVTVSWQYVTAAGRQNSNAQCGAAYWGGAFTLHIDDRPLFAQVPVGGDSGHCPGSPLQGISISVDEPGALRVFLEGYWPEPHFLRELRLPIVVDRAVLQQSLFQCSLFHARDKDIAEAQYLSPLCQSLTKLELRKVTEERGPDQQDSPSFLIFAK